MLDPAFVSRYGPRALIAGASEGIGEQFARQLAARGLHLILVARRGELLGTLAKELAAANDIDVQTLALDLGSPEATIQYL